MKKKIYLIFIAVLLITLVSGCNSNKGQSKGKSRDEINVMASFNAVADITKEIGRDKVNVSVMVPKGTEAHDFEPKPKDVASLNESDLFIYNGLDMEHWAEDTLKTINSDVTIVEASKDANLLELKNSSDDHGHGNYDPHIWLSLKEAKVMAKNIMEGLIKVDAANEDYYVENFNDFTKRADELFSEYEKKFQYVKNKNFVTGHEAFAYLCRDFDLTQKSVAGVFNEGEATSVKLKETIDYCKSNNVKTIFMEQGASSKVTDTISKETGAKVEEINTLEIEGTYIDTMKSNLEKIYNGLNK
ncbi:MAG: zinc ABC transporter substrate-binding protein [Clostridium sp.]|uniref:metal ABC transporter solute-binding protein, Zn/Mn family n=1 Tax=Clostridium sp. TaxID=1506 RepID=UPI002A8F5439|nr:zinc ABC transporter substrate-binding protein [Clostridium sp.]MDY5098349.1 zinc ABC transporter substrate-binding protein [Clostridium sp.]